MNSKLYFFIYLSSKITFHFLKNKIFSTVQNREAQFEIRKYFLLTIGIIFTTSLSFYCRQPEQKQTIQDKPKEKNSATQYPTREKGSFDKNDFEKVITEAKRLHLDKDNINDSVGYADAAYNACQTLNKNIFLFPEKYYEKNKKNTSIIPKGKVVKLSPSDSFVILIAEKREKDLNSKSLSAKEIVAEELKRKKEIYDFLLELNFKQTDLEKVIVYIGANLNSFPTTDEKPITMNEVYLAAANGYLSSIDPHSTIYAKERWEDSMDEVLISPASVGMILSGGGNKEVVVENPLEDSPALKAGIRSGDVIIKIDKKNIDALPLEKVIKLLKGERHSMVSVEVKRRGVRDSLTIQIKRDTTEIKNVTARILEENPNIGYIKVTGFIKSNSEDTVKEIKSKLEELKQNKKTKLQGLILDLRNNSGGYLDLVIDTIDLFVKKGLLVHVVNSKYSPDDFFAKTQDITDLPMAVLVNSQTASGAELVAGSLQDHKRAIILGNRTFGNGSIQKILDIAGNNDYILKITSGRFFLPSENTTQVHGLKPDIQISGEEDGSFPYSFREEDKWRHLPQIPYKEKARPNFNIEKIQQWVSKNGKAKAEIEKRKNNQIKPDYFLYRAIDAFNGYLKVEVNSK